MGTRTEPTNGRNRKGGGSLRGRSGIVVDDRGRGKLPMRGVKLDQLQQSLSNRRQDRLLREERVPQASE